MSKNLRALTKRALEDGARYFRVKNVNPALSKQLYWKAWKDYKELVSWPQFFVFYSIYFKEGMVDVHSKRDG